VDCPGPRAADRTGLPAGPTRPHLQPGRGAPWCATSPAFQVVIIPALLPEDDVQRETELRRLAALLGIPYSQGGAQPGLRERVDRVLDAGSPAYAPYDPLVVATNVDRKVALIIAQGQEFAFPGVRVDVISRRQYPYGPLVSQLVGYMGAIPAEKAKEYADRGVRPRHRPHRLRRGGGDL
jgi:penicillin-binding protein 2